MNTHTHNAVNFVSIDRPAKAPISLGKACGAVVARLRRTRSALQGDTAILRSFAGFRASMQAEQAMSAARTQAYHLYQATRPALPEALYLGVEDKALFNLKAWDVFALGDDDDDKRHVWGPGQQKQFLDAYLTDDAAKSRPIAHARAQEIIETSAEHESACEATRREVGYDESDMDYDGYLPVKKFNRRRASTAAGLKAKLDAIRLMNTEGRGKLTIGEPGDKRYDHTHSFNLLVDGVLADVERMVGGSGILAKAGPDAAIFSFGTKIEAVCREVGAILVAYDEGKIEDGNVDALIDLVQQKAGYWIKRDAAMSIPAQTFEGIVEQVRIAFITGLKGCDDWQDPLLERLAEIGGADLSAMEGVLRSTKATAVEDQQQDEANKVFAEYLAYTARCRAFRAREEEAKKSGEDILAETRAYEARSGADFERISDAIDALPSTTNVHAVRLMRNGPSQMSIDQKLCDDQEMRLALWGLEGMLPLLDGQVRQVASDLVLNSDAIISETVLWA